MAIYTGERNWMAMEQRMARDKAEIQLQNLVGPLKGIEDWPAHRVYEALASVKDGGDRAALKEQQPCP